MKKEDAAYAGLREFLLGGLETAEAQLRERGCWCPGAGDEQCTLCIVRTLRATLKGERGAE